MSQSPTQDPILQGSSPPIGSSPDLEVEPVDDAPPLPPKRKGGRKPIYNTSEERKQRNRQAQAAFRERRTEYIKQLEITIKDNENTIQKLQQVQDNGHTESSWLKYRNAQLEAILHENGIDYEFEIEARTKALSQAGNAFEPPSLPDSQRPAARDGRHSSLRENAPRPVAKMKTHGSRHVVHRNGQSPISPSEFSFPPLSPQLASPVGYGSKINLEPHLHLSHFAQGDASPDSVSTGFGPPSGCLDYDYQFRTGANMLSGHGMGHSQYYSPISSHDLEHLGTERHAQADAMNHRGHMQAPSKFYLNGARPSAAHHRHSSMSSASVQNQNKRPRHADASDHPTHSSTSIYVEDEDDLRGSPTLSAAAELQNGRGFSGRFAPNRSPVQ